MALYAWIEEKYTLNNDDQIPNTNKIQKVKTEDNSSGFFTQRNFSVLRNAKLTPLETNEANCLTLHFVGRVNFALEAHKKSLEQQPTIVLIIACMKNYPPRNGISRSTQL